MDIDFKVTLTRKDVAQIIADYLRKQHQLEVNGEPKFSITYDQDCRGEAYGHTLEKVEFQVKKKTTTTRELFDNFKGY